jgi:hypothetical protein
VFELDGAFSDNSTKFFEEVWKALEEENIPHTMHWGKVNQLDFKKTH